MMDGEALRSVMRVFPQGVVVVTAAPSDREPRGVTVSSFMSVSLKPPLIVISIMEEAQAHGAIDSAGAFTVNILAEDQGAVSDHFATPNLSSTEQFDGVPHQTRADQPPLIEGCVGYLDCRIVDKVTEGDHTLFVGEVRAGKVLNDSRPLLFYSRRYWGVGEEAYQRD